MSFYMFLHFKSDIVPHLTPPYPPSPILLLVFVSFSILNLLLSTHIFFLSPPRFSPVLYSMIFGLFPFPLKPCHLHDIVHFCNALFSFSISSFFFPSPPPPLCSNTPPLHQSLYVRGLCCGCRRPALYRRRSTRQGRGVRTRCSLGIVCTSCPGPPIAPTCCLSMLPGKTSNRTEPPPPTSEGASHCPGWSNSICCCIDLLAFDVDMDGDSKMVPLWCQLAHSEAIL